MKENTLSDVRQLDGLSASNPSFLEKAVCNYIQGNEGPHTSVDFLLENSGRSNFKLIQALTKKTWESVKKMKSQSKGDPGVFATNMSFATMALFGGMESFAVIKNNPALATSLDVLRSSIVHYLLQYYPNSPHAVSYGDWDP